MSAGAPEFNSTYSYLRGELDLMDLKQIYRCERVKDKQDEWGGGEIESSDQHPRYSISLPHIDDAMTAGCRQPS